MEKTSASFKIVVLGEGKYPTVYPPTKWETLPSFERVLISDI
jgi:hypothetical protein